MHRDCSQPLFDLRRFQAPPALAEEAARVFADRLATSVPLEAPFLAALSGGRIAKPFLHAAAAQLAGRPDALTRLHVFWADERCVAPNHSESNYRLAHECLLAKARIPASRIHRIQGELDPDEAARSASHDLEKWAHRTSSGVPVLDLVFLGMGEDGHIASLFPDNVEAQRWQEAYQAVTALKPPCHRITLTYPVLWAAREVHVLISGPGKENALRRCLEGDASLPLGRVVSRRHKTFIYMDFDL